MTPVPHNPNFDAEFEAAANLTSPEGSWECWELIVVAMSTETLLLNIRVDEKMDGRWKAMASAELKKRDVLAAFEVKP
jgi:hypothetical protein